MTIDILQLNEFYASPQGQQTRAILLANLQRIWQCNNNDALLGLGYVLPFLDNFAPDYKRSLKFMPAQLGAISDEKTCLIDETQLPLADGSIDNILLVHFLEHSNSPHECLAECWRVLAANGQLILIVPNYFSIWRFFSRQNNPFTKIYFSGEFFSRQQLFADLSAAMFQPISHSSALHFPVLKNNFAKKFNSKFEYLANKCFSPFGSVLVVRASKMLYRGAGARQKTSPLFVPAFKPEYS